MNDDRTEPVDEALNAQNGLDEAAPPPAQDGGGIDIELISISDLDGGAPQEEGTAQLIDVIGCEVGSEPCQDQDEIPPSDKAVEPDGHPLRWTGVATGADVVTPDDVHRDESRFAAPAHPAAADSVNFRLNELSVQMNDLLRQFEEKLKYDAHKEKVIDVLHSELQEYKTDLIKKYITNLVMDLIKVVDDARKMATHFKGREPGPEDQPRLIKALEDVAQDMEDVFQVQGVTPFTYDDERFDPGRQRVVRKIDTGEASKDKTVAESLAPGYEWDGKVIRREMVAVYSYNPALGA